MKKHLVEGFHGIRMKESVAREIDALVKTLPKECQTIKRKASTPTTTELVNEQRADISLVSVETIDREGEVVLSKGMDVAYFQQNPIVTFAHKYDELPVGRAKWIKKVAGGLRAMTIYDDKPSDWIGNWFPDAVWHMTKSGTLKGKSIGFIPTKIRAPDKSEVKWKDADCIVERAVLLEYAIAPVPVNQLSLVEMVSKGITSEVVLKRFGLTLNKLPEINQDDLITKILSRILIDPQKIADQVLANLRKRGSV